MNHASYDRIAPQWDAARSTCSAREQEYLDAVLAPLTVPAAVLDLGCGTGRPLAEAALARGHHVTGVDQSEGMLAIARRRLPAGEWIHARLEDFVPPTRYGAVICWDALFHVERTHHRTILARVADGLTPGGRLMLTVGGSAHPAFTDTMFGESFFYDSHPPETATALLRELGFELLRGEFLNHPTGGRDKGRYAIVAARPGGRT